MFAPQTTYTAGPGGYASSGSPVDIRITAQSGGVQVGDVVMLPAPSFNAATGEAYWPSTAVTLNPTTAGFTGGTRRLFGVCLEAAAQDALVRIRVRGVALCKAPNPTSQNAQLQPTNGTKTLSALAGTAAGNLCVAIALDAGTGTNNCLFDGLYGLGTQSA